MGSAPGESTKIIGVVQVESANDPLRSKSGEYVKISPRLTPTNFLIKEISFSSLISLMHKSF